MKKLLFAAVLLGSTIAALPAKAQVWVNGKQLNQQEIAWLAHYTCGPIYPGNYWINMNNGYWGFVGSFQAVGHVKDRCPPGSKGLFKQGNMSREGRLYSPGELLR